MIIHRAIEDTLKRQFGTFPIIALTGPRQAGKTTLLKDIFSQIPYVSLEDLDTRSFAREDPRGFLTTHSPPVIFDEVQHVPELFSYIQTKSDEERKTGQYILSGSQHFLLLDNISQSLAGRAGILHLLPFTMQEVEHLDTFPVRYEDLIYRGLYPRIWDIESLEPSIWYRSYIKTYLERDVRSIKEVTDLSQFHKFLKLCAGRTGQILNLSALANDTGITHNTARSWISVLETSFVVFLLKPYYKNFNKQITKSPKLYFYDAGLATSLLGIESPQQIITHPLKGALFETMIVSEFIKYQMNTQRSDVGFYLRDKTGHEIDYLAKQAGGDSIAVEIKAGKTVSSDYFENLRYWDGMTQEGIGKNYVVYGGDQIQKRTEGSVLPWKKVSEVFK
ncbi:AAA family ATPase [Candidatus Roizmanbacteria bacterium CG_4_9_14_0_2_um_filter_39_13]|uniref:AAA family ATPase n=2 Tax=Candidatus Roizmaniibacteriota TaxID=1752723 RepID=A0A2M8F389_9BACT|nr:MAG: AAA family ATPase [Candidatus Roizmanbacteria bacterium CG_4_10_14_0_2_um_filter_39_12]PJC33773.1 MAG: AAA family ATPase [Candidatus Roizmanbacteria bacterium CG_4_9_14_0_2_um_filter_39_13]PJE61838.1 MAG: AAA family ATPase [Candidatus Roizmanbacteria bacterium CG10_big_fil_rev_8_21_14_0_10_39_12]